jgi:hypothetical protein
VVHAQALPSTSALRVVVAIACIQTGCSVSVLALPGTIAKQAAMTSVRLVIPIAGPAMTLMITIAHHARAIDTCRTVSVTPLALETLLE